MKILTLSRAMYKAIFITVVLVLIGAGAFVWGRRSVQRRAGNVERIVARVILERIQDQYFLVTKTLFLDETVEITLTDVKGWKGLFVGEKIRAQGLVRVEVGVDLNGMSVDDLYLSARGYPEAHRAHG